MQHDRNAIEVRQSLQVLAHRHHGHRESGALLPNGFQHLAAHLFNRSEVVLDPHAGLGNPMVSTLLAF